MAIFDHRLLYSYLTTPLVSRKLMDVRPTRQKSPDCNMENLFSMEKISIYGKFMVGL